MATTTEEARVRLGIDSTAVSRGLASVKQSMTGLARDVKSMFVGGAIANGLSSILDSVEQIANRSQSLGVSASFLQDMENVGIASGKSQQSIEKMLAVFSKSLSPGQSLEQELYKTMDRLNEIKDPTTRAAEAARLFGKSWADALDVMAGGSSVFKNAASEFSKFSDDEIKKLLEADAALDQLKNKAKVMAGQAAAWITDKVGFAARTLGVMFSGTGKLNPADAVDEVMRQDEAATEAENKRKADREKATAAARDAARAQQKIKDIMDARDKAYKEYLKDCEKEARLQEEIRGKIANSNSAAEKLAKQFAAITRDASDTSLSEAFALTDAARGELKLDPLTMTEAQMDIMDKIRRLENDAKQARIFGNTSEADKLIDESFSLREKLGFLGESERFPKAQVNAAIIEQREEMRRLVWMAQGAGMRVNIVGVQP